MANMRKILWQFGLRSMCGVVFLVTFMGLSVTHVSAGTSPVGIWNILANGSPGTLQINTLTSSGTIYGSVLGNPLIGTYTASTGAITFLREIHTDFSYYQIYTGTLAGASLSGSFDEFYGGITAYSSSTIYAWSASLSQSISNTPPPLATEEYVGTANGYNFELYDSADAQGTMTGTIFGNPILGYRSPGNNAFNFVRVISSDFSYFQIFIASTMVNCGGASQTDRHFIGGQFVEVYGPTNGYSGPAYSWSAYRPGDQCI